MDAADEKTHPPVGPQGALRQDNHAKNAEEMARTGRDHHE